MSLSLHVYLDTPMTPAACRALLASELGLAPADDGRDAALVAPGLSVFVKLPPQDPMLREATQALAGFEPSLVVSCSPVLAGANFEHAHRLLGQVFDHLLGHTSGPAAIVLEADRLLVKRGAEGVLVRTDAHRYLQPSTLAELSGAWGSAALKP